MAESYPNWVENTVGKGEIAGYKPFLLFQHCFQKACFRRASKTVIVWEWVNTIFFYWLLSHINTVEIMLKNEHLKNYGITGEPVIRLF